YLHPLLEPRSIAGRKIRSRDMHWLCRLGGRLNGFLYAPNQVAGVVAFRGRFIESLTCRQLHVPSVDIVKEPARLAILESAIAVSRQRVGEEQPLLRTGNRYIKQPALLFQFRAAAEHHLRGEEVLFQ